MNISKLYNSYEILTAAKDKISEHSKEYADAIAATKGGEKEKRLAVQIISKFFKHFPSEQQTKAMNAIFDLCEDEDSTIRIAAMKSLPSFCKDSAKSVGRVTYIMAQLLQVDEPQEYNIACTTLLQVLKDDPITVIKSIFHSINEKDTNPAREKCIKFITTKIKTLDKEILTTEVEELIVNEVKITLQDTTAEEFILLMDFLHNSGYIQSFNAQEEIVEIISEQIEIDQKFDPLDDQSNITDRLVTCIKYILPFFSNKLESTKFVLYYADQVLPKWETIGNLEDGLHYQLILVQQLAEMSQFCGTLKNPTTQVEQLFKKLEMYMPLPPEEQSDTMPHFNFAVVESLLFAFHRLARQCPDFLTKSSDVLKDFRSRLLYFSRGVQGCLKVLNFTDREKIFSPEEKRMRDMSPKLLSNINTLIRDLFYQPPIYKCNVTLSFKLEEKKTANTKSTPDNATGNKRHIPITYGSDVPRNKQSRPPRSNNDKKIYTPPGGKFSQNFYNSDRNPRYNNRGRGPASRARGRGRGGNYRN